MRSAAWNCSALASSSRVITGISTWRTTTRGLAMPTRTATFFRPTSAAQSGDGVGDGGFVGDLALAHRLARQRDLREHVEARRGAGCDLGDRDGVGADVEADQAAGHASPPPKVWASRYSSRSLARIRKCLPTRIAGNAPERMRR